MSAGCKNLDLPRRGLLPAWLLSLALHALLLIGLAWGLRPSWPGQAEPIPRAVEIVLAPPPSDRALQYTRHDSTPRATAVEQRANPLVDIDLARKNGIDFLPAAEAAAELALPDVLMPGADVRVGSGSDRRIHHEFDLSRRRGSGAAVRGSGDEAIWGEEAARRAAKQALGAGTEVSIFGSAPASGRSFVFAIDRSHSMGGGGLNALAAARAELSRAISHLADHHRFQVVAYHHQCLYLQRPRLLPATEDNKALVAPFIEALAALGGTGHETAVRASLAMEPDVIFLLTDGGDPHLNDIQLANLRKLAERRTAIHTLQFGFGAAEQVPFMQRLAEQNRGSYTYVDLSVRRGL